MIDCVANIPVYVLATRIFEHARHMIDVPWGQVMGATIISRRSWERIPEDVRPRLRAIAREIGDRIDADARRAEADALEAMRRQGLVVEAVERTPWRRAAEAGWRELRGKVVPAELFDEVVHRRDAYRAERVAGAP
jgi:TRAP-type transport system periplasmic protein